MYAKTFKSIRKNIGGYFLKTEKNNYEVTWINLIKIKSFYFYVDKQ